MSIQTPKVITTLAESRAHYPTPVVSCSTKKILLNNDFLLRSTYETLDRNDSAPCEFHNIFQNRTGIRAKTGMFLPVSFETRDLSTGDTTLVQTDVDSNIRLSFVNAPVCGKATFVTNLTGNYQKPYFATSAAPLAYPTEASTVSAQSDQTLGALTLKPAALAFSTLISRQLVIQSKANIIPALIQDANRVANSYLDGFALGAINAVGNVPSQGILTSAVNPSSGNASFSQTDYFTTDLSAAITNTKLSAAVGNVEATAANDDGTLLFITSPAGASTLRTTSIGGASARFLVENNKVLGDDRLPLASSEYLSGVTGNLIFGRMSDLLVVVWGLELCVDPYSQMTSGNIVLNWILWCNVGLLHGPSFVVGANGNL